jgi:TPR repeat protein
MLRRCWVPGMLSVLATLTLVVEALAVCGPAVAAQNQNLSAVQAKAQRRDPDGLYTLGVYTFFGHQLPMDREKGASLLRQAADLGHAGAQNLYGQIFATGNGVPRDVSLGLKYFKESAATGNCSAQYNLGYAYESGTGVPRDLCTAKRWYLLAAAQGHTVAESRLATLGEVNC